MKPNAGPSTPVASKMVMVYESSFLISEEWVLQEETEIGLLEMLNDQLVRDACTYPKFLCDFSIRHPLTF